MAKTQVVKSKPGTSMTKWEEELAKQADVAAAVTGTASGTFISFRNGIITVDKTPIGKKMEAVVLSHCFENAYYVGKYDPDNPTPPICFAFGVAKPGMTAEQLEKLESTMRPHEKSSEPQNKDCASCPHNQWGSADQGRGKACGNKRRLALIAGDEESLSDIAGQKVYFAKTPVTSNKNWDGYVKNSAKTLRRPPLGLVTIITTEVDPKTQFTVNFEVKEKIDSAEQFEAIIEKAKGVEIDFPYLPPIDDQPAKNKGNPAARKFAGKAAPGKAARR